MVVVFDGFYSYQVFSVYSTLTSCTHTVVHFLCRALALVSQSVNPGKNLLVFCNVEFIDCNTYKPG